jgi:hypothetical protein
VTVRAVLRAVCARLFGVADSVLQFVRVHARGGVRHFVLRLGAEHDGTAARPRLGPAHQRPAHQPCAVVWRAAGRPARRGGGRCGRARGHERRVLGVVRAFVATLHVREAHAYSRLIAVARANHSQVGVCRLFDRFRRGAVCDGGGGVVRRHALCVLRRRPGCAGTHQTERLQPLGSGTALLFLSCVVRSGAQPSCAVRRAVQAFRGRMVEISAAEREAARDG